jgi:hypothetical protein
MLTGAIAIARDCVGLQGIVSIALGITAGVVP